MIFRGAGDGKDDGRATVDTRPAKAQAASDQAWFTPRSSCPQGPSAGSRFGPESGWAPSPTGSRSRSPQPVKGRHVTDRWWAAGAPGNGRKNPRRICGNAVPRLPKRIHCACGDGHHRCGAAGLAARGRGPEIRVHDGLHRFPSPNHGTAVEAINGKRRSAVRAGLIAQLCCYWRSTAFPGTPVPSPKIPCDRLTWCRTGFPGCCRRSPAAGCIWRPVPHVPGHRS